MDPYEPAPNRIRWTRAQCEAIADARILTGRYELIDGEIISKIGQKPPHSFGVVALSAWLISVFGPLFVRAQLTIDVGEADPVYNEPEPDLVATVLPNTAFADHHPGPEDIALVAEISDASLRFDRLKKAALYSAAGITEYWIVDVIGRQVFVHRQPKQTGYGEIVAYDESESIATLAHPDKSVAIADLLPPLA